MLDESGHFLMSMDSSEQLVIGNGEVLLINSKTGESFRLGSTIGEARVKLEELGKDEAFPDFMTDYTL